MEASQAAAVTGLVIAGMATMVIMTNFTAILFDNPDNIYGPAIESTSRRRRLMSEELVLRIGDRVLVKPFKASEWEPATITGIGVYVKTSGVCWGFRCDSGLVGGGPGYTVGVDVKPLQDEKGDD